MADEGTTSRTRATRRLRQRDTIVIAAEGEKTEPDYFKELQRKYRGVNVTVIPRKAGDSDPRQVLCDLIRYKNNQSKRNKNIVKYWIVIDHDGRAEEILDKVAADAETHEFCIADSNPAFELWLILHHRSLDDYSEQELAELHANRRIGSRTRLEKELVSICGSYSKSRLNSSDYLPRIMTAISNAEASDKYSVDRQLKQIGSRVYKLAQSIIDSAT